MPVISALNKEEQNDPEQRFLDATLGGKTPNRSRTGGEDDETGHEPQRPGGERIAEIDEDKLDEPNQVEGEIRLGLRRIAKSKSQPKHEQSGCGGAEEQRP
jgi:hypothetical protein